MVLAPFLAIGLGLLLSKVSSDNAEDMVKDVTEIAVVATSKDLQKQFENQTNVTIRYESLDKAKKALNKDKIAGYVSVSLKKEDTRQDIMARDRLTKRQRPEL